MRSLIKTYWLPVVVLFVIFFDELFNCAAIAVGFTVESGIKQYEAMLLAAIGYSMLAYNLLNGKLKKREHQVLLVLFAILFLYLLTPVFYSDSIDKHTVYLLVYGAESIPAAIIGMSLAKSADLYQINDLLPFFVIPISILVGILGLTAAMMGTTVGIADYQEGGDTGMNYQTLSYFMAFCYTYSFYYAFYGNQESGLKNIMLRVAMTADMLFCVVVCLMGGGRGGFVYIVAITLFMIFYYLKSSKRHRVQATFFIIFFVLASLYFVISMGVMQSAGMNRVVNNFTEDDTRKELYLSAFDAFISSPIIGKGVGSIWWTVGFYCHNMILDILAETGLIGAIFLLNIIWGSFKKLYKLSDYNKIYLLMFMIMAGSFFNYMFSGYYIGAIKLYFVCSFVYCLPMCKLKYIKNQDNILTRKINVI